MSLIVPEPGGTGSEITRVFLLTDTDVLVQDQGTSLWRSVSTQPAEGASPTPAQLRNLKRVHPAYQGRLARAGGNGARRAPGLGAGRMEIYNPLTATWSAVPGGAGRAQVGDAVCFELPDGRLLIGGQASSSCATYDPGTDCWSTSQASSTRHRRTSTPSRRGAPASVIAVRVSN